MCAGSRSNKCAPLITITLVILRRYDDVKYKGWRRPAYNPRYFRFVGYWNSFKFHGIIRERVIQFTGEK